MDDRTIEVLERLPRTMIDHDNKHFFAGWLDRRLVLNRCGACGVWHHPPRPVCPSCWSTDVVPTEVSGTGTIHLVTFLHQGPPTEGIDYSEPHPVVTVELTEQRGLRITSTVIGAHRAAMTIGAPVSLAWIEREGVPYPVFELSEQE